MGRSAHIVTGMDGAITAAGPLTRAAGAVRRHGVRGAAARGGERTLRRARRWLLLSERHLWFEIPAEAGPPPAPPDGYRVRRGDRTDIETLAALGVLNGDVAAAWIEDGDQLWVGTLGDELVYSIWLHRGRVPAVAMRGGWMPLPADVLCLEGAYAMPRHRHLGVGRCAVRHAMAANRSHGRDRVVVRIAQDNIASRKSVAKLGGRGFARMRFLRVGSWRRIRFVSDGDPALTAALRGAQLSARRR
jgi:GNAT superfamily N-acetyltransferase